MKMVRSNNATDCETEEGDIVPDDELPKSQNVDHKGCEEGDAEESQWLAFSEPVPLLVKARFNITEIEVPSGVGGEGGSDEGQEKDDNFLQMLIEEGIPVNYLPSESDFDGTSNVGVLLPPEDHGAERTLNHPPQILYTDEDNGADNVVEIMNLGKSISTPLYFHLVPSQTSLHNQCEPTPQMERRRSTNPTILLIPPDSNGLPMKKKVRFDLPGRKASLVGEYEIISTELSCPEFQEKKKKTYSPRSSRSRKFVNVDELSFNGNGILPKKEHRRSQRRSRKDDNDSSSLRDDDDEEDDDDDDDENYCRKSFHIGDDEGDDDVTEKEDHVGVIEEEEDGEDTRCGLNSWTPDYLQRFARSEFYLVVFCMVALAQGMLFTYNIAIVSTLQNRFHMTSSQAGFILTGNDISQIMVSVFIGYYGAYANRPRWLGFASLLSAFAALVASLPHFIYGAGEIANKIVENANAVVLPNGWKPSTYNRFELCGPHSQENCTGMGAGIQTEYYFPQFILFVSQLMVGVANSIFWTVGVSYLDDNVNKKKTSLHIGFFTAARVIGPTFGFLFGGHCLSYWIDPTQEVDLSQRDPKWIGAWWLGFLCLSVMIGVPGSFYFCFPKRLPHKNKNNYYIQPPICHVNGNGNWNGNGNGNLIAKVGIPSFDVITPTKTLYGFPSLKDLPKALLRLFRNKIWMANMFSNVFFVLALTGYLAYKPKYIQTQFRKSASSANFYTGMTTMTASVIGIAISAVVLRFFRPRTSYVTAFNVFLSMYAIIAFFALMTIHCPSNELAGHLPGQEKWACSEHCSCTETFSPICAEDGVTTFYSPCFAGCTHVNPYVSPIEYVNCTCFGRIRWDDTIAEDTLPIFEDENPAFSINEGWAVEGYCPDNCRALPIYLIIHLVNKVIFATGRIGATLINLRSVDEKDKTLALGCLAVFVSFAGFIPASFIMGGAIDSTCLVWNKICGEKGSCSFYDNERLRLVMHVIPAALLVLSCIGDVIVHVKNTTLQIYGEPDEDDNDQENYEVETLQSRPRTRRNTFN